MSSLHQRAVLAMVLVLAMASAANAQTRPYIGYVYPAGGQQGTKFQIKVGGQRLDEVEGVIVTGEGASGKVLEYLRKMGPQDATLLREQLDALKKGIPPKAWEALMQATEVADTSNDSDFGMLTPEMMSHMSSSHGAAAAIRVENLGINQSVVELVTRIRTRMSEYVLRPASVAISSLVVAEITIAADAAPGKREVRLVTPHGLSNPMTFYVGQIPEVSRAPMLTSEIQVLGKEGLALRRRRPGGDAERRITLPCTVNGQIASAEVHHYRFAARKGQRLVISTSARELVPFIADAVPGWFQPVLTLYDAKGKEVAYNDDYRFFVDPLILFEVPKDGDYVLAINDAIFRGREDFVYRVVIDESPLVTSIFPLGARVRTSPTIAMKGWNLEGDRLDPPKENYKAGTHLLTATKGNRVSNRVPFALDTLPEDSDHEPNDDAAHAQKVAIPVNINGRIDRPDDWDVFEFTGRAGETIVAEVKARRLNSPLDSLLRLTDEKGTLLAINDDYDDPSAGANTHYADSYLTVKLPADGKYYVHLGDTTRNGGEEYAYRLRISGPRPDFALRVMPSSVFLRRDNKSETVTVFIDRREGCTEPVRVSLKDPPKGISANAAIINPTEPVGQLTITAGQDAEAGPFILVVEGIATIASTEVFHEAVPTEDRMQAFLWRHLVPADNLAGLVFDPDRAAKRSRGKRDYTSAGSLQLTGGSGKFTPEQVVGRLRQLDRLFEDGLLSKEFHRQKVAECGVAQ
jgi:hypothetical protein